MPSTLDPYAVLGVRSTASAGELKKAYRLKQRQTHPDTGGSNEAFRAVEDAWAIVGQAAHRRAYDVNRKAESFVSTTPRNAAPTDYQKAWAKGGAAAASAEYARREREETARWNAMYSEQNEWFDRAKKRNEEYATSPVDDEFDEKPRPVVEGLTAWWLKFFYILVVVLNVAAILSTASTPAILLAILPGLGIADAVVIVGVILVSVLMSVCYYSADRFVRLLCVSGVAAVGLLGASVLTVDVLFTMGDVYFANIVNE